MFLKSFIFIINTVHTWCRCGCGGGSWAGCWRRLRNSWPGIDWTRECQTAGGRLFIHCQKCLEYKSDQVFIMQERHNNSNSNNKLRLVAGSTQTLTNSISLVCLPLHLGDHWATTNFHNVLLNTLYLLEKEDNVLKVCGEQCVIFCCKFSSFKW